MKVTGNLTATNQTIYIYYGKPAATTSSNYTSILAARFWDSESDTLESILNSWTEGTDGYFRVQAGKVADSNHTSGLPA